MADHYYVELVTDWLASNWDTGNYPGGYDGEQPAIVDGDDATADHEFADRKLGYDLSRNNAVIVDSSPTRQNTPIGTGFDYKFEDAVSVEIVGAHTDQFGHLSGSDEFRALYNEARRVLHNQRVWPDRNQAGDQHAYTLLVIDESNLSSRYKDYYEYDLTVGIRGHEELP